MDSIRAAMERASVYLSEHPEKAAASDSAATAFREDGLRFRVEGPWSAVITATLSSRMPRARHGYRRKTHHAAFLSNSLQVVDRRAERLSRFLEQLRLTLEVGGDHGHEADVGERDLLRPLPVEALEVGDRELVATRSTVTASEPRSPLQTSACNSSGVGRVAG